MTGRLFTVAVMGPEGMKEMGENILYKCNYAQKKLETVEGIRLPYKESRGFMEFVINVDGTGKTVADINKALLEKAFSWKGLSAEFATWASPHFTV